MTTEKQGQGTHRRCTPQDAIDGVEPTEIATPRSISELQEALRGATANQSHVIVSGNRTKINWGAPPIGYDLGIETLGLPQILEHQANDLVVRASSNVTLEHLQAELLQKNQRLAIDNLIPNTTIGGLIATGISGPLRFGFGSVRDLIIGINVVRADGVLAQSGGRVVKNVAGYDLAKLYTGSYGTLGVVAEAHFRLHAAPEVASFAIAEVKLAELQQVIANIHRLPVAASAFEVFSHSTEGSAVLAVLIEGTVKSVTARANATAAVLGTGTDVTEVAPRWWNTIPESCTFKIALEIANIGGAIADLHQIAQQHGIEISINGSAGVGVLFVGVNDSLISAGTISDFSNSIRSTAKRHGGTSITLRAPLHLRAAHDVWGDIPALDMMRRVKAQFDPNKLLSPGRFVGGI